MTNESERDLFRLHRESQNRYTYFLLAAAGAAIGFALTQTNEASLSLAQLPLGIAGVLWAFSFYCGCKQLQYVTGTLYNNAELLRVQSGRHQFTGSNPQAIAIGSSALKEILENMSKKVGQFGAWQFRFLVFGSISYVGWHIFEMWLRGTV